MHHAVLRCDAGFVSDWFALSIKHRSNKLCLYYDTIIKERDYSLYVHDMAKIDVHEFYKMVHEGYYVEKLRVMEGIVYEQQQSSLTAFIRRQPVKKHKVTVSIWI